MSKKNNMPPEQARLLAALLAEVRPADVGMLRDLELDWPGSRALLARLGVALVAQDPQEAQTHLRTCLCAGLDAYRTARKARAEPGQRALVTQTLSPLQHRALRLAVEDHG